MRVHNNFMLTANYLIIGVPSFLFSDEEDCADKAFHIPESIIFNENGSVFYYEFKNFNLPNDEQEFRYVKIRAKLF